RWKWITTYPGDTALRSMRHGGIASGLTKVRRCTTATTRVAASWEPVNYIDHWERTANFDLSDCAGAARICHRRPEVDRIARHCARMRKNGNGDDLMRDRTDSQRSHSRRIVLGANVVGLIALVLHDADMLRQAREMNYAVPAHVTATYLAAFVPMVLGIWWGWRGRIAASANAAISSSVVVLVAIGFVHLVGPDTVSNSVAGFFGMWAQSYHHMRVDGLSWFAAFGLMVICLGIILVSHREKRRLRSSDAD